MKKILFLALLAFVSCSKDDESYLRASFSGQDLVRSATKIEKKYNKNSQVMEVWLYNSDSTADVYQYLFMYNIGAYYYADIRAKYKIVKLLEQSTGILSNNNGRINGTAVTLKTNGAIEFKNYQL